MFLKNQNANLEYEDQWKNIYMLAAVTTFIAILGTLFDIIIGTSLGGDLSITMSAVDKFQQFNNNWLLGLYNFDLLNVLTTILMIPGYLALWAAHRRSNTYLVTLATIIYFIGAIVFIANNAALPMLDLSNKYASATSLAQKNLFAAAGEAIMAKGAHGSPGAFAGFILLTLGNLIMAVGMLKGRVFKKTTAFLGILGSLMLAFYVILVTFVPEIKNVAVGVAAPGGLLALVWTIMVNIKLFQLARGQFRKEGGDCSSSLTVPQP